MGRHPARDAGGLRAAGRRLGRHDLDRRRHLFYQGGSERNSLSVREVAGALVVSDPAGLSNVFTAPPLHLEVKATDRRGRRQLERDAATVRVAA
jgi:hypothetical protein